MIAPSRITWRGNRHCYRNIQILIAVLYAKNRHRLGSTMEFKFDLQQVSESDMACVDGVCFVPPASTRDEVTDSAVQEESHEVPPRD